MSAYDYWSDRAEAEHDAERERSGPMPYPRASHRSRIGNVSRWIERRDGKRQCVSETGASDGPIESSGSNEEIGA